MAEPKARPGQYYLQYQGSEFGPFAWKELKAVVTSGKIQGSFFIWTDGLENWVRIQTIAEMNSIVEAATGRIIFPKKKSKQMDILLGSKNRRGGNRWPVIATCAIVDGRQLKFIGICREISASGMSVVVDRKVNIELGELLPLEIRPISLTGLVSFRITGRVLWDRPKESAIGILFSQIAREHREALASYVSAVERKMVKL
jgi:hypothetical protein